MSNDVRTLHGLPAGVPLVALPSMRDPRIVVSGDTAADRFRRVEALGGSTLGARARVRLLAMLGAVKPARAVDVVDPSVAEWVRGVVPEARFAVSAVGKGLWAGKTTSLFVDTSGNPLVWVKAAATSPARMRIRNEADILGRVASDAVPKVIGSTSIGDVEVVGLAPMAGHAMKASALPDMLAVSALEKLGAGEASSPNPWVRSLADVSADGPRTDLDRWAAVSLPTVPVHGDFVPWNVLVDSSGSRLLLDWEYGVVDGAPGVDPVYWVLQTGMLVRRRSPRQALSEAASFLQGREYWPSLEDAESFVRVVAFWMDVARSADGRAADDPSRTWLAALWSGR